jgi:hypothetical protein
MLAMNIIGLTYVVVVLAVTALVLFVLFQLGTFLRLRNAELRATAASRTDSGTVGTKPAGN